MTSPSPAQAPKAAIKPVKRVLLAIDDNPASQKTAAYVANLPARDMEIRVISVVDNPRRAIPGDPLVGVDLSDIRAQWDAKARDALAQAAALLAQSGIHAETLVIEMSEGDISSALIDAVDAWHADLLVLGARQHHGLLRWVEGTVSETASQRALCSTLIVPTSYESTSAPARILFATDGSAPSMDALRTGVQLATPATLLRAVYVADHAARLPGLGSEPEPDGEVIEDGKASLKEAAAFFAGLPNPAETLLASMQHRDDDIAHAIVRCASQWSADLVVVGTHGRHGMARWLWGSVAADVVKLTKTPLLLGRAPSGR